MYTKGELTREKIIREARQIVNRKGLMDTSISDIISATGLKKGSLYFHFSGKNALSLAVLEKSRDEFLEFLDLSLVGNTPGERLDNFFNEVIRFHKSAGFIGGCIFGNTALEMGDKDKRISVFVEKVFAEWAGKIRKVVKAAQKSKQVRNDIPAGILACNIIAGIEGGIMLARLGKNKKPLKDCLNSMKTLLGLKV
ncbi:MAG: TetR/AcrR family transcriptional regulator [Candidatus Omnitrophica bacterium]|nr:TetR/AcrR family transcriptional regulator [Candidatus Omnitrophota bacterium]